MNYKTPPKSRLVKLLRALKQDISDNRRASNDPDDNKPGTCVTVGASLDGTWDFQTGDNAFAGCAYHHHYWGVVSLYRDSNCEKLAAELVEEIEEAMILNSQFDVR